MTEIDWTEVQKGLAVLLSGYAKHQAIGITYLTELVEERAAEQRRNEVWKKFEMEKNRNDGSHSETDRAVHVERIIRRKGHHVSVTCFGDGYRAEVPPHAPCLGPDLNRTIANALSLAGCESCVGCETIMELRFDA